jgi:AcrR family transcriptional regulator
VPKTTTTRVPRFASLRDRRAANREQMVAGILDCAREIMRESGVASLNMQVLAKQVGIQAPSLYEYFEGKNAIFDALYAQGLSIFQDSVLPALEGAEDFASAVRTIYAAETKFLRDHPDLYQIVFNNALPAYQISDANIQKVRYGLDKGLAFLQKKIEQETFNLPVTSAQAALLVDLVLTGIATRLISIETTHTSDFRKRYEGLVDVIITLLSSYGTKRGKRANPAAKKNTASKGNRSG